MPTGQHYGTNVPQAQLTVGINNSVTSFAVNSLSSWPATPFTAAIDIGQSNQEVIDVTAVAGNNITSCTRAVDGTTAFAHSIGATLTHVDIGRDFREARAHIDATGTPDSTGASVHGLTSGSSVVGTADAQNLTNKTITSGTFSGTQAMGSGNWSGSGSLVEAAVGFTGLTGAQVQTSTFAGTVAAGPPGSGTWSTGQIVFDQAGNMWYCTSGGTPGTWTPVGGRALIASGTFSGSQTITIPSWANTVQLFWNGRSATATAGGEYVTVQLNGDSGSNYTYNVIDFTSGAAGGTNSGATSTFMRVAVVPRAGDTASYSGNGQLIISNCQSTTFFKSVASHFQGPISATNGWVGAGGGEWQSTAKVTSISLGDVGGSGFAAGSYYSAYGLI